MWKLWTELELWWLDLQLGDLRPTTLGTIVLVLICVVIGYMSLKMVIWRSRMTFVTHLLNSASFVFPPPVVRLKIVIISALIIIALWYLWK